MCIRHRLPVVAPRLKRQRRPEREHLVEMRLPVRNARFEDRRKQRILPHAGIKGPDQRLDHRLVDADFFLRQRHDSGAPLLCAARFMIHFIGSHYAHSRAHRRSSKWSAKTCEMSVHLVFGP
jgi:hypothetical protein